MIHPADDQTAKGMQPGKQTFDFPASAVAAKLASVQAFRPAAIALVRRDQSGAVVLRQADVERIAS